VVAVVPGEGEGGRREEGRVVGGVGVEGRETLIVPAEEGERWRVEGAAGWASGVTLLLFLSAHDLLPPPSLPDASEELDPLDEVPSLLPPTPFIKPSEAAFFIPWLVTFSNFGALFPLPPPPPGADPASFKGLSMRNHPSSSISELLEVISRLLAESSAGSRPSLSPPLSPPPLPFFPFFSFLPPPFTLLAWSASWILPAFSYPARGEGELGREERRRPVVRSGTEFESPPPGPPGPGGARAMSASASRLVSP
jgi:hypothetical protein